MFGLDRYGYDKKRVGDMLRQIFFASGGICGSHSAFRCVRAQNVDALFSISGGTCTDMTKSVPGDVMLY
jgi:hypothetical protein